MYTDLFWLRFGRDYVPRVSAQACNLFFFIASVWKTIYQNNERKSKSKIVLVVHRMRRWHAHFMRQHTTKCRYCLITEWNVRLSAVATANCTQMFQFYFFYVLREKKRNKSKTAALIAIAVYYNQITMKRNFVKRIAQETNTHPFLEFNCPILSSHGNSFSVSRTSMVGGDRFLNMLHLFTC